MRAEEQQVEVVAESDYLKEQSHPERNHFVFGYTITIRNVGTKRVRLLTRHWLVTDANGRVQEVRGDGVVGEQPTLAPGEQFQYSSGTFLETPVGSMHGSYGMVDEDGVPFTAKIPPFSLAIAGIIH